MFSTDLLVRLVEWWTSAGESAMPPVEFAPDFVFDSALHIIPNAGDFVDGVSLQGRLEGLRFLEVLGAGDAAVVVFEGVDEVTGLAHRMSWVGRMDDQGRVNRITAVYSQGHCPSDSEAK